MQMFVKWNDVFHHHSCNTKHAGLANHSSVEKASTEALNRRDYVTGAEPVYRTGSWRSGQKVRFRQTLHDRISQKNKNKKRKKIVCGTASNKRWKQTFSISAVPWWSFLSDVRNLRSFSCAAECKVRTGGHL